MNNSKETILPIISLEIPDQGNNVCTMWSNSKVTDHPLTDEDILVVGGLMGCFGAILIATSRVGAHARYAIMVHDKDGPYHTARNELNKFIAEIKARYPGDGEIEFSLSMAFLEQRNQDVWARNNGITNIRSLNISSAGATTSRCLQYFDGAFKNDEELLEKLGWRAYKNQNFENKFNEWKPREQQLKTVNNNKDSLREYYEKITRDNYLDTQINNKTGLRINKFYDDAFIYPKWYDKRAYPFQKSKKTQCEYQGCNVKFSSLLNPFTWANSGPKGKEYSFSNGHHCKVCAKRFCANHGLYRNESFHIWNGQPADNLSQYKFVCLRCVPAEHHGQEFVMANWA